MTFIPDTMPAENFKHFQTFSQALNQNQSFLEEQTRKWMKMEIQTAPRSMGPGLQIQHEYIQAQIQAIFLTMSTTCLKCLHVYIYKYIYIYIYINIYIYNFYVHLSIHAFEVGGLVFPQFFSWP